MTQEIIEMARQAGIEEAYCLKHNQYLVRFKDGSLETFAKLVEEKEREANAKMVDHILKEGGGTWGDAIRARGTT